MLCPSGTVVNRHDSGRAAQEAGALHEAWAESHHDAARNLGILACAHHNEPHWRRINGRWERVAATVADYTGTLYEGPGKSLASECKATSSLRLKRSAVTPVQQTHLGDVSRAGGLALLVAGFYDEGMTNWRRYAVLWDEVSWEVLKTAESVAEAALAGWRVPETERCYLSRFAKACGPAGGGEVGDGRVVVGDRRRILHR